MAPDPLQMGGYQQHHHHHVMPQPQLANGNLANDLPDAYHPRRTEIPASVPAAGAAGPCMSPSWTGFIHTTFDALIILEACLQGTLSHIPRRPHDRERQQIITGGNVFIYEENASGIKRWTDGVTWSPSRIMGNFLVYRELSEPFPAGEKKKAKKRKRGVEEVEHILQQAVYSEEDRKLVGSLVDSYGFKPGGLIKKTLNVKYNGVNHHIVSYYNLEDVKSGVHKRPKHDPRVAHLQPREELVRNNFKVSAVDPDEDLIPVDPFGMPAQLSMPTAAMFSHPPSLQVFTNHHQPTSDPFPHMTGPMISQSPLSHSSLSATTPIDYFPGGQFPFTPTHNPYLASVSEGLAHAAPREDRIDSVTAVQQPQFKNELADLPEMPVFSSAEDGHSPIGSTLTHTMSQPADMFTSHHAASNYNHMDDPSNWPVQMNNYHNHLAMPPNKRRQTAPVLTNDAVFKYPGGTPVNGHHMYNYPPTMSNGSPGMFVS